MFKSAKIAWESHQTKDVSTSEACKQHSSHNNDDHVVSRHYLRLRSRDAMLGSSIMHKTKKILAWLRITWWRQQATSWSWWITIETKKILAWLRITWWRQQATSWSWWITIEVCPAQLSHKKIHSNEHSNTEQPKSRYHFKSSPQL